MCLSLKRHRKIGVAFANDLKVHIPISYNRICVDGGSLRRASVQREGLQHRPRYSADVVLVVAQSCEDPGRVHVLDVGVVAVGVPVHVSQFACAKKKESIERGFQIHN